MASIWQLTVIVFPKKTILTGVVLEHYTNTSRGASSFLKSAYAITSSYFRKTLGLTQLTVRWGNAMLATETDRSGGFFLETDHPYDEGQELEIQVQGRRLIFETRNLNVYAMRQAGNLVISDIDDTILVSHTNTRIKRLLTTVFRPYARRKPVEETSRIFDILGKAANDHLYVSRSEYNLFPMLSNFLKHHELPRGPLLLTPFLSLGTLIRNKKDPDFKSKTILFILEHSAHEKVVLIGDDTQHDLEVYAEIARVHGSRIKKIFIRQTDAGIDKRQSSAWSQLDHCIDNMVYYNDETETKDLKL